MAKPILVKAAGELKLYVKYSDGLEGEINLSRHKDDSDYKMLLEESYFSTVTIDEKTKDICWSNGISLCKNAVYKQLELKRLAKSLKLDLDKF